MAVRRRGFALIFVVVTLAVMAILATVILANSAGGRERARVINAVTELLRFGFEIGSASKKPSFQGDIGKYPGRLSHLYAKIATTDNNSCGAAYSGADVNKWNGPYHLVPMVRDSNYQMMPGVIASDTLLRVPASGGGAATLSIVMRNVAIDLAQDLEMAIDGVSTGAGPQVTFTPNGSNPVTVLYNISITAC